MGLPCRTADQARGGASGVNGSMGWHIFGSPMECMTLGALGDPAGRLALRQSLGSVSTLN